MSEIALLARAFDRVPEPDEATVVEARAALVQLIAATENSSFAATRRSGPWPVFLRRTSSRLRVAVVAIALLLVLAGIATATYLGVRTWVSSSPRGPQFKNGYRLATIFDTRVQGGYWSGWTLDPRGHDLYGLRWLDGDFTHPRLPELMRISGVDRGTRLHATRVLDLRMLAGPRFRPTPPEGPPGYPNYYWHQALTVAPNGDLFLLATGRDPASALQLAGTDVALFVVHPDGAHQRLLSVGELVQSRALSNARGGIVLSVVATASDRLWVDAESWSRVRNCDPGLEKGDSPCHSYHFFQIADPNADGDWADRVVHPVGLPRELSAAIAPWPGLQLAAEPPLPSDRSLSVLAAMFWDRRKAKAVYRLTDRNRDGDLRDPGEVRVVLAHHLIPTFVAPRVIRVHGVARREVVAAGLTRADRVSLISASGAVTDIARSFQWFGGVLAGPRGAIYPIGSTGNVYRLEPASGHPSGGAPVAGLPAQPPEAAPTGGKAQLVLTTYHGTFSLRADGTGLRKLAHGAADCYSADGRLIAYRSDAEAPHELFLYVAGANGTGPRKVTERDADPLCPFSTRWLLLISWQGEPTLVRHDLRTGDDVDVVRNAWSFALSPDGTRLAYVSDGERLLVLDIATLQHHLLARQPVGASFTTVGSGLRWSPDGKLIAYVTGPGLGPGPLSSKQLYRSRHRYVLWVRDVTDGSVLLRTSVKGAWPTIAWSPDGENLLVCVKAHTGGRPSCGGANPYRSPYRTPPAKLLLVQLSDRSARLVARGQFVFAGFGPSSQLAYATPTALFLRTSDGRTSTLANAPEGRWPGKWNWLGWSPDGRYIGLGVDNSAVSTIDVRTGHLRVLRPAAAARWWTR